MRISNSGQSAVLFALVALVFLLSAIRLLFFASSSVGDLVEVIPDDAFYYFQMAAQRSKTGLWTFDGNSPATGFHVLYGYFLLLVFKVVPDISLTHLFLIVGTLSCLSISFSVYILTKTVHSLYGFAPAIVSVVPFFSYSMLIQGTLMMESWLVILFCSLTFYLVAWNTKHSLARIALVLFVVGCLGSLSRVDYGMLPGMLFCSLFLGEKARFTAPVLKSFSVLAGAIFGVALVLMQNYLISGQLTQASAQIKYIWSSAAGHSVVPFMHILTSTAAPVFDLDRYGKTIFLALSLALLVFGIFRGSHDIRRQRRRLSILIAFGCYFTVLGYTWFYKHNSGGLNYWYSSVLIIPLAVGAASIAYYFFRQLSLVGSACLIVTYIWLGLVNGILSKPWPEQSSRMEAAYLLREWPQSEKYGSWNAGILSYFSQKPIVNLDGLTNDDVYPYIVDNKLLDYIKIERISYIIDSRHMVDSEYMRVRGGYEDTRIFSCITPVKTVGHNDTEWNNSDLVVFGVELGCL